MVAKAFSVIFCSVFMVILSTTQANSEYGSRIVGGVQMPITGRPFQVAVLPAGYICGGSLITLNAVLTAAHCVFDMVPSQISVRAGSNYYYYGGFTRNVLQKVVHEYFNPTAMDMNIAILKTITPFVESSKINTIPLATVLPPTGSSVVVSGYGTTSSGGSLAKELRAVTVEMIDFNYCNSQYSNQLTESMFCAAANGKDSCQGDSGGPLTYNNTLIGVVSWGNGCADINYPGIYTRVPMFQFWIQNTIASF